MIENRRGLTIFSHTMLIPGYRRHFIPAVRRLRGGDAG